MAFLRYIYFCSLSPEGDFWRNATSLSAVLTHRSPIYFGGFLSAMCPSAPTSLSQGGKMLKLSVTTPAFNQSMAPRPLSRILRFLISNLRQLFLPSQLNFPCCSWQWCALLPPWHHHVTFMLCRELRLSQPLPLLPLRWFAISLHESWRAGLCHRLLSKLVRNGSIQEISAEPASSWPRRNVDLNVVPSSAACHASSCLVFTPCWFPVLIVTPPNWIAAVSLFVSDFETRWHGMEVLVSTIPTYLLHVPCF